MGPNHVSESGLYVYPYGDVHLKAIAINDTVGQFLLQDSGAKGMVMDCKESMQSRCELVQCYSLRAR